MLDEVASIEAVEADLNRFIERRAQGAKTGRERANAEADLQRMADARRTKARRQEVRAAWIEHYRSLALAHHDAAARYAEQADELEEKAS